MTTPPTCNLPLRLSPEFAPTSSVMSALPCPRCGDAAIHREGEPASHEQKSSVVNLARTSPPDAPTLARDGVIVQGQVAAS
jgi:hypothetical protein